VKEIYFSKYYRKIGCFKTFLVIKDPFILENVLKTWKILFSKPFKKNSNKGASQKFSFVLKMLYILKSTDPAKKFTLQIKAQTMLTLLYAPVPVPNNNGWAFISLLK